MGWKYSAGAVWDVMVNHDDARRAVPAVACALSG
jgi:hypothetical protein